MESWESLADRAAALVGTPAFVISADYVRDALSELEARTEGIRARHWLSVKTQPVRPLLEMWRDWGHGVEVVSPFELQAALRTGFSPDRIIVNGTAKHQWLPALAYDRLTVHFDSVTELPALKAIARDRQWRVGLRCHIPPGDGLHDADHFGMSIPEFVAAAGELAEAGVAVRGVHFHLHTNVHTAAAFDRALRCARDASTRAGLAPEYVDIGGGLPVTGEASLQAEQAACETFDSGIWSQWLATITHVMPSAREVWLENGRFLTARAGALVLTVIDRKERDDALYLICDGGRTNHARMAAIERHDVRVIPKRTGAPRPTVVCGPTCATVDRLGTFALPPSVQIGDRLLWLNAGAYAIPLETRFSFGLAPVVWVNPGGSLSRARPRETAEQWWNQWGPG